MKEAYEQFWQSLDDNEKAKLRDADRNALPPDVVEMLTARGLAPTLVKWEQEDSYRPLMPSALIEVMDAGP